MTHFEQPGRVRFVYGQDRPSGKYKPKSLRPAARARLAGTNDQLAERQRIAREQRALFRERNNLD